MLRIRLRRTGKKKQVSYRVVVADQRAPRDGAFVEIIGHYNPRTEPKTLVLKEDRVKHWLSVGAQPSEIVHRLLHSQGLIDAEPPKRPTRPSKADERAAAAKASAEATAEADAAAAAEAKATAEAAEATTDDPAEETSDDSSDDSAEAEAPADEAAEESTDESAESADSADSADDEATDSTDEEEST